MKETLCACVIFFALAAAQALFLVFTDLRHLAESPEAHQPQVELELAQCLRLFPGLTPDSEEAALTRTSPYLPLSNQKQQHLTPEQATGLEEQRLAVRNYRNSSEKWSPSVLVFPLVVLSHNVTEDTAQWDWRGTPEGDLKGDNYTELLRWCLKSLFASGPIDYELLFLVNQEGKKTILAMDEAKPFVLRFHVFAEPCLQSTDAFLPKLRLIEALEDLDSKAVRYDRVLMLDVDFMARGPVSALLQKIERRDVIYVKAERTHCETMAMCLDEPTFSMKRYSRAELFCLVLTGHVPMNGGSFGFRDGPVVRKIWRALREGSSKMQQSTYMDQPIFNHVLSTAHMRRPGGLLDFDLFESGIQMTGEAGINNAVLVHFNFDGRGSKLSRMKEAFKAVFGA